MADDLSPIMRAFEVECSVEHAFDTWTQRIDLWWPLARHSVSGDDAMSVAIELRRGGRIFETTRKGEEIAWGTVNLWEPPNCFGYLWFIKEVDASEATQVTITFTGLGPALTRVAIEHKGWEKLGAKGAPRRSGNARGWDGVEEAFRRIVKGEAPDDR